MKWFFIVVVALFCGINASPISQQKELVKKHATIKECSIGPSYWCHNITTARDCGAMKHCIQTVWEHTHLEADNDDICTICKDMVAQARDQLESNETQEELKEVFEGSCQLIPVKVVAKECMKMADEFIPELVEALASQMNPQMVCATAGLCNSVRIDQMLADLKQDREVQVLTSSHPMAKYGKDCVGCYTVVGKMEKKLGAMSDDQVLTKMVQACGHLGSLSSGCQEIIITYSANMIKHLREQFKAPEVCDLSGMCKARHHEHAQIEVEIEPMSKVGVVSHTGNDETCELCEQLVKHLRDVLVSNTTEDEFQNVLKGLCGQTKSFKDQCLSLVNEYYGVMYTFLVNELNPRVVCDFAGICHEEAKADVDGPLWLELPAWGMLPERPVSLSEAARIFKHNKQHRLIGGDEAGNYAAQKLVGGDEAQSYSEEKLVGGDEAQSYAEEKLIGGDEAQSFKKPDFARVQLTKTGANIHVIDSAKPLPIELMMPQTMVGANKEVCEFCQYFLHYVQKEITSPSTESEIKEAVDEACDALPKVIREQCRSFVETYGDAFVALLAQEIDPSQVCPQLGLCPQRKVALFVSKEKDSPTCPLCLYAMEQLDTMIKEDKTEANIRAALEKVCSYLPKSLVSECDDMVDKYSEEVVDMLIADFTPQEICVYLKLCAPKMYPTSVPLEDKDSEIMTNEIPQLPETRLMPQTLVRDDELVQRVSSFNLKDDTTKCVICEFVMTQLDDMLKNNATDEQIKQAVHNVCNYLPQSVAKECNDFVFEYADLVIQLLVQTIDPKSVCVELSLCQSSTGAKKSIVPPVVPAVKESEESCKLCTVVVEAMDKLLEDGSIEKDIDTLLEKVCGIVPNHQATQCRQMIDAYGPSIALLVAQLADSREVCSELKLCSGGARVRLMGGHKCTWGPSYWCQSEFHATACKATKHCQSKVWKGVKPSKHGDN